MTAIALAACIETSKVEDLLLDNYDESLTHIGLLSNGNVLELYENKDTITSTVIVSIPNLNLSCLAG
jgi:hypothetical protein